MEQFREHEKEFKKKQFSKKALLNQQDRNMFDSSGSDDSDGGHRYSDGSDGDYDNEGDSNGGENDDEDMNEEGDNQSDEGNEEQKAEQRAKDKEYLVEVQDFVKQQI